MKRLPSHVPLVKLGKLHCCSHRLLWETHKTVMNLQSLCKLQMPLLLASIYWVSPCVRCLAHIITLKSQNNSSKEVFFQYFHFADEEMSSEKSDSFKVTQRQSRDLNPR